MNLLKHLFRMAKAWIALRLAYRRWNRLVKPILKLESERILWAEQMSNETGYSVELIRFCQFRTLIDSIPEKTGRILVEEALKQASEALRGFSGDPFFYLTTLIKDKRGW